MEEAKTPSLEKTWETDTVLTTCESVLYYEKDNVLFVSDIDGKPTDKDGQGFISKLKPDGSMITLKWASGLDAPKGMGISGDKLYVTNIDELVEINLSDGRINKRYPVPGAKFLNDVAINDGKVYFSDMDMGKVHVLENGKVTTLAEGRKNVNGLAFGGATLYALDDKGLERYPLDGSEPELISASVSGGDGLIVIDENTFVASRWNGEIWFIQNGEATKMLDSKDQNLQTADIGYLPEQKIVFAPRFFGNKVTAYRLDY